MKAVILALIVSISASTWAFTKLQNRAGYGNNSVAFKGVAIVFIAAFVVVFTLAQIILH